MRSILRLSWATEIGPELHDRLLLGDRREIEKGFLRALERRESRTVLSISLRAVSMRSVRSQLLCNASTWIGFGFTARDSNAVELGLIRHHVVG